MVNLTVKDQGQMRSDVRKFLFDLCRAVDPALLSVEESNLRNEAIASLGAEAMGAGEATT